MDGEGLKLRIDVGVVPYADAAELDESTRELRQNLMELDVEDLERPGALRHPVRGQGRPRWRARFPSDAALAVEESSGLALIEVRGQPRSRRTAHRRSFIDALDRRST
jgi:hypothetical protein